MNYNEAQVIIDSISVPLFSLPEYAKKELAALLIASTLNSKPMRQISAQIYDMAQAKTWADANEGLANYPDGSQDQYDSFDEVTP